MKNKVVLIIFVSVVNFSKQLIVGCILFNFISFQKFKLKYCDFAIASLVLQTFGVNGTFKKYRSIVISRAQMRSV